MKKVITFLSVFIRINISNEKNRLTKNYNKLIKKYYSKKKIKILCENGKLAHDRKKYLI